MNVHLTTLPTKGIFINNVVAPLMYGPVPSVLPVNDEADAVRLANGTDYGLTTAVWSHDGNRALRVSHGIKARHGREKGFAALHDISQIRTTITKHD